jgi:hypothetical protein
MVLVSWGSRASAAPKMTGATKAKPESADQKVARGLLERGQAELAQGRADLALDSFNAAKQVDDSFRVESAIADATLALGKPTRAGTAYRDFVAKNRATLSAEQVSISDAKLAQIADALARLTLEVSEPEAAVQVDGASVGQSPLPAPIELDPGEHELTLTKPGFVPFTQHFTLAHGVNAFTLTLTPEVLMGKLRVSCNTPGVVELLVNGQVFALLPWEGALPVGTVKLLARSKDRTSPALEVAVERDITKPVVLELSPNEGSVNVSSTARDALIAIDGHNVGLQHWHGMLPLGVHHVRLSRPGFLSQERDLVVQTGSTASIVVGNWAPLPNIAPKPKDDHGLYVRLDLAAAFGKASDGVHQECAANDANSHPQCSRHTPLGGGIGLRVGYRIKWIAPELFGMGTFEAWRVRLRADEYQPNDATDTSTFYGPKRKEDYVFFRYGWAAGAGVRVSSPTGGISATAGLGFGVFSQTGQYVRKTSSTVVIPSTGAVQTVPSADSSGSQHSYAPGLIFDGGVLLGSSPGTKLYLGVLAAIELAPEHSPTPPIHNSPSLQQPLPYNTPGLDVVSGTQFRIGPVLGFQFGY